METDRQRCSAERILVITACVSQCTVKMNAGTRDICTYEGEREREREVMYKADAKKTQKEKTHEKKNTS